LLAGPRVATIFVLLFNATSFIPIYFV